MFRWKYIIQRLVLVSSGLVLLWLLTNPLLKWAIVYSGTQAVGAKVEIGVLRSLLHRTAFQLGHLQVADPRSPMRNLFEVQKATFDLDSSELLRRRLVVRNGELHDMRLRTERSHSGAVKSEDAQSNGPGWGATISETGEAWLESTASRLGEKVEGDLESVRLGRELLDRWPKDYDRIESEVSGIGERGKRLVEQIKATKQSPLRSVEHYQGLLREIDSLRRDSLSMRERVVALERQIRSDRVALEQAKQHDAEYVKQHLQLASLDPETLTSYLLGEELGGRAMQLLQWVQWGRAQFGGSDEPPSDPRGVDVPLPGLRRQPSLLVQKLSMDGEGTSGGESFAFVGSLHDWTNEPVLHGKPATLHIESTGAVQMLIDAELDHTGGVPRDRLVIRCPQRHQPERWLGDKEKFALRVAPGESSMHVELDLLGDELAGVIRMDQPGVDLEPHLSGTLNRPLVAQRISTTASAIQDLTASLVLSGTITRPAVKLHSNVGQQLADGLRTAFADEVAHRQEQLVSEANQEIEAQLVKLQTKIGEQQKELLEKLQLDSTQINLLKKDLAGFGIPDAADKLLGEKGILRGLLNR